MVYRWLDESGVAHFTTQKSRIPSEFRDAAQEVGKRVSPAPGRTASTPATPAPVAAPPPDTAPAPSGPRVMPEGEFEEPPLGARGPKPAEPAASAAAPAPLSAPAAAPARASSSVRPPGAASPPRTDVAAPPSDAVRPASASVAAAPPGAVAAPAPVDPAALDEQIRTLEAQVGRDEAALQDLLSQPRVEGAPRLADREDFREIAQRLPKLQADLKALRQQRTRQGL